MMMRRMKIKATPNIAGGTKKNVLPSKRGQEPCEAIFTNSEEENLEPVTICENDLLNSLIPENEEVAKKSSYMNDMSTPNFRTFEHLKTQEKPFISCEKDFKHDNLHDTFVNSSRKTESTFKSLKKLSSNNDCNDAVIDHSESLITCIAGSSIKSDLSKIHETLKVRRPRPVIPMIKYEKRRNRIKSQPCILHKRKIGQLGDVAEKNVDTELNICIKDNDINKKNSDENTNKSSLNQPIAISHLNDINSPIKPVQNMKSEFKRSKTVDLMDEKMLYYERKLDFKKKLTTNGSIEKDKMTMFDLIFWNPTSNPMPGGDKTPKNRSSSASEFSNQSDNELIAEEEGLANIQTANDNSNKNNTSNKIESSDSGSEYGQIGGLVPQIKIGPNGELVIDEKSIMIETTAAKKRDEVMKNTEVVEETNDGSHYGKWSKRRKRSCEWTKKETARFYKALSSVGTDFSMMTKVFHWRSRAELKIKFKREEKINRHLIDCALNDCTQFDFSIFDESDYEPEEDRRECKRLDKERKKEKKKLNKLQNKFHQSKKIEQENVDTGNTRKKNLRKIKNKIIRRKRYFEEKELNSGHSKARHLKGKTIIALVDNSNLTEPELPNKIPDSHQMQRLPSKRKEKKPKRTSLIVQPKTLKGSFEVNMEEIVYEVIIKSPRASHKNENVEEHITQNLFEENESTNPCKENESSGHYVDLLVSSQSNMECLAAKSLIKLSEELPDASDPTFKEKENSKGSNTCENNKEYYSCKDNKESCSIEDKKSSYSCEDKESYNCEDNKGSYSCEDNKEINSCVRTSNDVLSLNDKVCDRTTQNDTKIKSDLSNSRLLSHGSSELKSINSSFNSLSNVKDLHSKPLHTNMDILSSTLSQSTNESDIKSVLQVPNSVVSIPISIDAEIFSKVFADLEISGDSLVSSTDLGLSQVTSNQESKNGKQDIYQVSVPAEDVLRSDDGSRYVQIMFNGTLKKIPVPPLKSNTSNIVVMITPDPADPMESIYHVYIMGPSDHCETVPCNNFNK